MKLTFRIFPDYWVGNKPCNKSDPQNSSASAKSRINYSPPIDHVYDAQLRQQRVS